MRSDREKERACYQLNVEDAFTNRCQNASGGVFRPPCIDKEKGALSSCLYHDCKKGAYTLKSNPNAFIISRFRRKER